MKIVCMIMMILVVIMIMMIVIKTLETPKGLFPSLVLSKRPEAPNTEDYHFESSDTVLMISMS